MHAFRLFAAAGIALVLSVGAPRSASAIPHADAPVTDQTRDTLIATGTLIRIAMRQSVSSAHNKPGDLFTFSVVDPVYVGDRIAIAAGTAGTGKILNCSPAHGGRVD